jgi:hypothetical protein
MLHLEFERARSITQESGEIWTGQADLQPIYFKSDRLLECGKRKIHHDPRQEHCHA